VALEIMIGNASEELLLFSAFASLLCMVIALVAVFFGRGDEKILGTTAAVFALIQAACIAIFELNNDGVRLAEVVFCTIELTISGTIALMTMRLWPLFVAAIFLVKSVAAFAAFAGSEVGVFAYQEVQITLRVLVALIVLWAIFPGKWFPRQMAPNSPRPL
jgi:hypothetical protein